MFNRRVFKEPNIISFPDDKEIPTKNTSIYELLLQTEGDYKKVSQILDQKISDTNRLIKDLTENIKNLPNDSFEEKLSQLKNDNLETMLLCDEFRKIASRKEKEQENFDFRNYEPDKPVLNEHSKKLSHKPPQIPKSKNNPSPVYSKDAKNNMDMYLNDLDDSRSMDSFRNSNNYITNNKIYREYGDVDSEDEINRRERNYKREAAMERLTRSKSSLSKYIDESEKSHNTFNPDYLVAKWRHKVTVPQPFEMTVREESKKKFQKSFDDNKLRKSRTLFEFQMEKAEKERQELEETKKQFRANPVPANVYIPLYETMQEESNQRRQFIREYNKEILKSVEKPFNFYKREMEKQRQKMELSSQSIDPSKSTNGFKNLSNKQPLKSYHGERQKTVIRAKEVPKHSNNASTIEKMKEDELFRLIKAEMRSKQLLEESKMPGNMAERQRIQEEKRKQKEFKKKNLSLRTRSKSADFNKTNKPVPNFSKIHKEWEEEIRMSYKEPYITQPKPFKLLTEERPLHRSTNDLENVTQNQYNSTYNNNLVNSEWNKSILAALEIAKPSTNKSTILRENAIKTKLIEEETKTHIKAVEYLAKKKREMDVSDKIRKSLDIESIPKGEDKRRQKTKELKIENEIRKENYQRQLDEIKKKVEQLPLLLETAVQKNKYNNGLVKISQSSHKHSNNKPELFNNYDERNNFGDPLSNRSSTDVSGSIEEMNSYQKNNRNHPKKRQNEDEEFHSNYGENNHPKQY